MADYDLNPELTGGGLLGGGGGSWLGNLFNFGGNRSTTADLYGDLFSKKQLAAIQQRESQAKFKGLLDVLSQAAAPSQFKKNYGQILGQVGSAMMGADAGDKAAIAALGGQKTAAEIAEMRRKAALQAQISPIVMEYAQRFLRGGGGGMPGAPAGAPGAPPVPNPGAPPGAPPPGPAPHAPPPNPAGQAPPGFAFGTGAPRSFALPPAAGGGPAPLPPTPPGPGSDPGAGAGMPPIDPASQYAMMMGGLLGAGGGGAQPPFPEGEGSSLPPPDTVIPSGPGGLLDPDIVRLASTGGGAGDDWLNRNAPFPTRANPQGSPARWRYDTPVIDPDDPASRGPGSPFGPGASGPTYESVLGRPPAGSPDELLPSTAARFTGGGAPAQRASLTGSAWEIANHNYGGLRKPGVNASPSQGGFQSFDTPEEGLQAISRQLDRYASGATTGKPLTTIRDIVSTWAPPSENPTATLIARAARIVGVDPDQPIDLSDPAVKARMITATIANEQGGRVPVDRNLIAQVANAPPGSVSYTEGSGGGSGPASGGGAPAAGGGVSDKIPGVGASPQELAALDMLAEMAGMKTPFKSLLDAYYKTPGYLGTAAEAEQRARSGVQLEMDPLIRIETERAALRAQLELKPQLDAAIEKAKNPVLAEREQAKAEIDRITRQMEQTGAAGLDLATIRVPDGQGGQMEVQGTRAQAVRAAHGLAVPELGIPARRSDSPAAPTGAAITPPPGTPVLSPTEQKIGGAVAEELIELRKTARNAIPTIRNTHDLRTKLDSGMFTGLDADWNLFGAKLGDALGMTGKTTQEKIANTEIYISKLGEETANLIKSMKLGPPTSDADVKFAERIAGRQNLSAAAIRELLEMRERYARLAIQQYNDEAQTYSPRAFGGGRQTIPMPEPYVQKQGTSPSGHGWREQ